MSITRALRGYTEVVRYLSSSIVYGALASVAVFVFETLVPAIGPAVQIATHSSLGFVSTARIITRLILGSIADPGFGSIGMYALFAALAGINVGLIAYFIRQRRSIPASGLVSGFSGALAAFFGIGCAACGSTLAIALLGSAGGTFITSLPYQGAWLDEAGLALMIISAIALIHAIRQPLVCEI